MSGTTNTIDVLLIVDADFLLANPTRVGDAVFLLAQRSQVDQSPEAQGPAYQDGGYELWIDVKKNDIIRWRATTLSRNADISAVISSVFVGAPAPGETGNLSNIDLVTPSEMLVPYMKGPGNTEFGTTEVTVSYWQANAAIPGKLSYRIEFYLLNSAGENINLHPFSWDPFITITQ
jgi:hypothetical protein